MPKPHRTLLLIIPDRDPAGDADVLQMDASFKVRRLIAPADTQILAMCRSLMIDGILVACATSDCAQLHWLEPLHQQMGDRCPPIVVLGEDNATLAVQAFKNGAADYLIREQTIPTDLHNAIHTAIDYAEQQRELAQCQERFQISVENMLDCFGIFSAMRDETGQIFDFRIDYLNAAACANNCLPREMQIGRGLCETLPAHRESGLFDEYCQLVETGEPLIKESLIYEDNYGTQHLIRAFDIRATRLHDGFVASWRDITDRKRLELELSQMTTDLRQQQQRLQRLIDTAPIGIGIGSVDGTVKVINDAMLALHGYTREAFEQRGMNWRDFAPPESEAQTEQAIGQLRQQHVLPPAAKELVRPDGSRVPIWISATQWLDNIDEHVAFAIDLTSQKQAEVALQVSQQRYRELAEAMPQMVWTADATGAVNYWNQRWYEYSGLSEAASLGLACANTIHPDERDRALDQWSQCVAQGESFEIEYRVRRWDGVYRWFISRGVPTHNQQGAITGWIGTITDIDQQKRLEERFRLVMRAVNGLIFDFNLPMDEVYRSEKLYDLIGVPAELASPSATWWHDRIHPDDMARMQAKLPAFFATGNDLYESEYRVRHEDGHWVDVWERGCLVRDEQGQVIRIVGSTVDVSQQQAAIRARYQTELALREAHIQLEAALAAGSIYTWRWQIAENRVITNQSFARLFGVAPEGAIAGLPVEQFINAIHPDDQTQVTAAIERAIATGEVYATEFRIHNADGVERWVVARGRVEYDAAGNPIAFPGALADITDYKQVEAALRRSEKRYRTLFESMEDGFCVIQVIFDDQQTPIDYRFLEINPAFEHQTGLQQAEGKTARELLPNLEKKWFDIYGKVALTGESTRFENGSDVMQRWFDVYAFRIGQPSERKVAILFKDISERKQAEAALQQSEERYRCLAELIPQLVWTATPTGALLDVNQRWLAFTGFTPEQVQILGWQPLIHPADVADLSQKWTIAAQTGMPYQAEGRIRRVDGAYRWHLHQAIPQKNEQGQVVKWFGTATDIEGQKQLEVDRERLLQEAQKAREAAERANRIKDEFLAVLSHELRSPLNPILGWTKLLQDRKLDPAKTAEALATIERNARLQTQLIDDLLDVAKILRGKLSLNIGSANLVAVITAAMDTMKTAAVAKSIHLHMQVQMHITDRPWAPTALQANPTPPSPSSPPNQLPFLVAGDAVRLQQIVWNLLSNAIKFTPTGGQVTVRLSLTLQDPFSITDQAPLSLPQTNPNNGPLTNDKEPLTEDEEPTTNDKGRMTKSYAQITVTDTGKGIRPDFLPHIFESFRQEDASTTRQYGGLGLGLAIVRQLVEAHGGAIAADSPGEGLGATFTVWLPLLPMTPPQPQTEATVNQEPNLIGTRVLLVDDEPDARELLTVMLTQYGAVVTTVASAADVLANLEAVKPDVVLSDIGMPNMDGYALIQQIRQLPPEKGGQVPAIALTAYAGDFDQQRAIAAGFHHHLAKPIEPTTLLKTIATLLQTKH